MKNDRFESRKYILSGIVLLIFIVYLTQIFSLQINNGEHNKSQSDNNAFYKKTVYPARGQMYDRNGKLLVSNKASYDIIFIPSEIKGLDTLEFCNTLGITVDEFSKRMERIRDKKRNPGYSTKTEQIFMTRIPEEILSVFQEKMFSFKGFDTRKRYVRQFECNVAGALFGDIGEVSQKQIDKDSYYISGDYIGTQGLEASYEEQLRGVKGTEILLRDAHRRIKGKYEGGAFDTLAIRGKDLTLSIDLELQMLGERLMKGKIGSIVAIEPETGEILCMVSSPSYDPNLLTGRDRGENYKNLSEDKQKPLMNRAIMGTYPPGSTFKTSQAAMFLEEGVVTPQTAFPCSNGFILNKFRLGCHYHSSPTALKEAIATSCNAYFCWGLHKMFGMSKYGGTKAAMNRWRDYMVSMGFGYKLGVDLPGEARGMIPNGDYYTRYYGNYWKAVTVISISIGQGEVTLTPLQIANLGAIIANKGHFISPHLVKKIENDTISREYLTPKKTMVGEGSWKEVIKGMRHAVTNGTCREANLSGLNVCGKTGTAENARGDDHSVFLGFAPMDAPKIAISVYVENGGYGAKYGVPIGALMLEKYLNGKLSPESEEKANEMSKKRIYYGQKER